MIYGSKIDLDQEFDHENVQWNQTYGNEGEQFDEKKMMSTAAPKAKRARSNNNIGK